MTIVCFLLSIAGVTLLIYLHDREMKRMSARNKARRDFFRRESAERKRVLRMYCERERRHRLVAQQSYRDRPNEPPYLN
jgi:hypothetical protein